jgi:hypothetical protein
MRKFYPTRCGSMVPKFLALVGTAALGTTAYGQATVEPISQPRNTLAPYVLERTSLEPRPGSQEPGGTLAYRPWFENGAWTGDLIQYEITADGIRVARDDIGRYPRDGADWRGTNPLWSARYAFPDYVAYNEADETNPSWECVEEAEAITYWSNRNVFTMRAPGVKANFLWTELNDAQQAAVDSGTHARQTEVGFEALQDNPFASEILNFVRGDRSRERCKGDGIYRWRFSLLGAIINSRPAYVPVSYIPLSGGTEEVNGLVVVGANDGMLHGFSAADGTEQFAYIPSMLLDKVGALRISPYTPSYYVDGELRHANIAGTGGSRHIVAGGLGAGDKGLFVIDVTNPIAPRVSRELSGRGAAHIDPAIVDDRIGYIHGRPTIAQLEDGNWYAVSGNGYDSTTGQAKLVLIQLNQDGTAGATTFINTDTTPGNGLSAPSLVDTDGNGRADVAYAGDLKGNLWRFDLASGSPGTKLFATGAGKPITVQPDIARHPVTGQGFMVYFGTGSLLSGADALSTDTQSIFGIWDRGDGATVQKIVSRELKTATLSWAVPQDGNLCGVPGITESQSTVRFVAGTQGPVWTGDNPDLGWQVDLPRPGERLIGHPQIRAERVQFITTNPYDMADPARMADDASGSWILQLDLATGGNATTARALFDLNKNCALDTGDGAPEALTIDGVTIEAGRFPVGVNLGPFNIAQPAFARVLFNTDLKSVIDGVYINALQLPSNEPPDAPATGPLDVMTDSPINTPAGTGLRHSFDPDDPTQYMVEPTKSPFATRPFPEASGPTKPFLRKDGAGGRVDGHSFGYLQHHGVQFVDFFDLEPRRGLSRLDAGATYIDENGNYLPIVLDTDIDDNVVPRISQQELNKVTEVGIDPVNQKFIVVVANADLSRENELTIGCRSWPVYEYQTMVMQAFRSTDPMAALAGQNLIFTLAGIRNEAGCDEPTLRLTPTQRIGAQDATMGTLPGCVNNTDLYEGPSRQEYLLTRKNILDANGNVIPPAVENDLYSVDPHITAPPPVNKSTLTGFRWRNGALTVQLLAVNGDNTSAFTIQDVGLPVSAGIEGEDFGFGGIYAKAFDIQTEGTGNKAVDVVVPVDTSTNGMLYELSMYWHWGDMARFQSEGVGGPVVPICYGTKDYVPSIARETEWFTPGKYAQLTADFTGSEENEALQAEYATLIALLQSGQTNLDAAVIRLQEILSMHPDIADYHRLRHYVANSKQLQDRHLIAIDGGGSIDLAVDGTPVDVVDIERDLLPSLGPNYQLGRRSWIDLVPEE